MAQRRGAARRGEGEQREELAAGASWKTEEGFILF